MVWRAVRFHRQVLAQPNPVDVLPKAFGIDEVWSVGKAEARWKRVRTRAGAAPRAAAEDDLSDHQGDALGEH